MYFDPGLLIIGFVFMGIGYYVQNKLKSKFHKYSQVSLRKKRGFTCKNPNTNRNL